MHEALRGGRGDCHARWSDGLDDDLRKLLAASGSVRRWMPGIADQRGARAGPGEGASRRPDRW